MHLKPEWISAWARWQNLSPEVEEKLKEAANRDPSYLERYFVLVDADERIYMSLSLFEWMPGLWAFTSPRYDPDSLPEQALSLFQDVIAWAKKRHLALQCRLQTPFDQLDLQSMGWHLDQTRFEFEAPVSDLPDDQGSPLSFRCLGDDVSLEQIAQIMQIAASGDPDFDPEESALTALQSYQQDPDVNHEPDCFQVAYFKDQVAGIVIAQNNPHNRWGRITYMALLPEMRAQGLGQWLYRHGFGMLKAQGAQQYCGGTVADNYAMLKLFADQGLESNRTLLQWVWNP